MIDLRVSQYESKTSRLFCANWNIVSGILCDIYVVTAFFWRHCYPFFYPYCPSWNSHTALFRKSCISAQVSIFLWIPNNFSLFFLVFHLPDCGLDSEESFMFHFLKFEYGWLAFSVPGISVYIYSWFYTVHLPLEKSVQRWMKHLREAMGTDTRYQISPGATFFSINPDQQALTFTVLLLVPKCCTRGKDTCETVWRNLTLALAHHLSFHWGQVPHRNTKWTTWNTLSNLFLFFLFTCSFE